MRIARPKGCQAGGAPKYLGFWFGVFCAGLGALSQGVAQTSRQSSENFRASPPLGSKLEGPEAKPSPNSAILPPTAPALAYEPQMLRLLEIMGSLSYLASSCDSPESADYLENAKTLINAQTSPLREKLAGAYNRGFRVVEATYVRCTTNAQKLRSRYVDEGARLTRAIGLALREP